MKPTDEIPEEAVTAYLETLLWSETLCAEEEGLTVPEEAECFSAGETFEDGTPLDNIVDVSDLPTLAPEMLEEAREDLEGFRSYCLETIGLDPFRFFDAAQVAHDFALSRNGHGAGFFDREYAVTCKGPGGHPSNSHAARYAGSVDGESVDISQELQAAAKTFGTHGVALYVDAEGALKVESHG